MALTNAQKLVLKAAILAETDASIVTARGGGVDEATIAAFYNADTSPAFKVWLSSVNSSDIISAINFDELGDCSAGDEKSKAIPAMLLTLMSTTINPSNAVVRGRIQAVFGGIRGGASMAAIVAASIRTATRAEKLLASGYGTATQPALMGWEGDLTEGDITAILAAT